MIGDDTNLNNAATLVGLKADILMAVAEGGNANKRQKVCLNECLSVLKFVRIEEEGRTTQLKLSLGCDRGSILQLFKETNKQMKK
ncbi:hypothetical protein TNCV_644871 [Trichonephila clavipes]|nr:hypothetical protein TNCV_644871 [Trichonephila clavipes]